MSSSFCALEEAFEGQQVMKSESTGKKSKKDKSSGRQFEQFSPILLQEQKGEYLMHPHVSPIVPAALPAAPAAPDPDRAVPIAAPPPMTGAPSQAVLARLESTNSAAASQFFPLPGNSADEEEWQKAFMLEGSDSLAMQPLKNGMDNNGMIRANGSLPVGGKPTLWQQIPQPILNAASLVPHGAIPTEITARLDQLTRQLESLTGPTPVQSTAELFLFVAVGLLLLLAMDTLLRFASSVSVGKRVSRARGGYQWTPNQWQPR